MKNIITILLSFLAYTSFGQKKIDIREAKNHVGDVVTICTKIYGGKYFERDSLTLLNAGAAYPKSPLTLVIRGAARSQFNKPEEYYRGREVCVTGKIELFKDKPQIEVTSKAQLAGK